MVKISSVIVYTPVSNLRHQSGCGTTFQPTSMDRYLHMNTDTFLKADQNIDHCQNILANAFHLLSLALHMDHLPACNQNLLKRDWSVPLRLQVETKMLQIPKLCHLLTGSAFICRHLYLEITF